MSGAVHTRPGLPTWMGAGAGTEAGAAARTRREQYPAGLRALLDVQAPMPEEKPHPAPANTTAVPTEPEAMHVPHDVDPLIVGILRMLREAPEPGWVSMPRLVKQLRSSGSEVLRTLHVLSDAHFGPQQGLGWVQVRQIELRWQARLTELGRHCSEELFAPEVSAAAAPPDQSNKTP